MKAWLLKKVYDLRAGVQPLELADVEKPFPSKAEILIKVSCCGVCHTELDEIEGRTPPQVYPVIPGHQVVGTVEKTGSEAVRFRQGDRVGAAWIFSACGVCNYCRAGLENLCAQFRGTGRDANGGYAEYMTISEKFAYRIPDAFKDTEAAPLLCAGAIGYRSLRLTELKDGQTLGLTGFGASGHLVLMMARHLFPQSKIIVFARSKQEQSFALSLGASWAGDISDTPPFPARAIIDTTPAWNTVVQSLLWLEPGGRLVINAIRKESKDQSALLNLSYTDHLWMEKEVKSVANITTRDVDEFLAVAAAVPLLPEVEIYPFSDANRALLDMKLKPSRGAKVLELSPADRADLRGADAQ